MIIISIGFGVTGVKRVGLPWIIITREENWTGTLEKSTELRRVTHPPVWAGICSYLTPSHNSTLGNQNDHWALLSAFAMKESTSQPHMQAAIPSRRLLCYSVQHTNSPITCDSTISAALTDGSDGAIRLLTPAPFVASPRPAPAALLSFRVTAA